MASVHTAAWKYEKYMCSVSLQDELTLCRNESRQCSHSLVEIFPEVEEKCCV